MSCVDCGDECAPNRNHCPECLVEIRESPYWQLLLRPAAVQPDSLARACVVCASEIGYRRRNYCSRRCAGLAQSRASRERRAAARPRRFCSRPGCGAELVGRQTKWCSDRCFEIAYGTRRAESLNARMCALAECDAEFVPRKEAQRCCCEKHGKLLFNREARAAGRSWDKPETRRRNLRAKTQRRRAAIRTNAVETVHTHIVAERDGWRCGICRRTVSRTLAYPHPRSASLDHIVPLSKGGEHSYANTRLAHLSCNVLRGNRCGDEQLALIG